MKRTDMMVWWSAPVLLVAARVLASAAAARSAEVPDLWMGMQVLPENAKVSFPIEYRRREWKARLTPEQYSVLRMKQTDPPFASGLCTAFEEGVYHSAATGQPLFRSSAKFYSTTGWPSFFETVSPDAVVLKWDCSGEVDRVEVLDSLSGSHLGHVFDDGPAPTGLRFCINSSALIFVPEDGEHPPLVSEYYAKYGSVKEAAE
jgi:methionine-R-sulfoxide reductase